MKPGQPAVSAQKSAAAFVRAGCIPVTALVVLLATIPASAALVQTELFKDDIAVVGEVEVAWIDPAAAAVVADPVVRTADAGGVTVKPEDPRSNAPPSSGALQKLAQAQVETAKPHNEDKPIEGLGLADRVRDWLARANREFQTTVIPRLTTPGQGSSEKDSIARKLDEVKEQDAEAAEAARRAREAVIAEQARQTEEARKAREEAQRIEDARKADEAKQADDLRKAAEDAKRREDERKALADAKRIEDERKAAEDARRVEEARRAEEDRRADEQRKIADEQKQAEAARKLAEEAKRLEEARKADEARKVAEAAEAKRLEDARKAAEDAKRAEAERKAQEAAKQAEQARQAAEAKEKRERLEAEAARIDAQDRVEQEAQHKAADAKRVEDEKAQRLEDERARIAAEKAELERRRAAAIDAEKKQQQSKAEAPPPPALEPRAAETGTVAGAASQPKPETAAKQPSKTRAVQTKVASRKLARGPVVRRWIRRAPRCQFAGRRIRPPGLYTIASGDTLWRISRRHYRVGWLYWRIYRANRAIIRNPNLIYPCQRIFIPPRR